MFQIKPVNEDNFKDILALAGTVFTGRQAAIMVKKC